LFETIYYGVIKIKNFKKGRTTIELAIVLPIIFFITLLLIYVCILKYQEVLVKSSAYIETENISDNLSDENNFDDYKLSINIKNRINNRSIIKYNKFSLSCNKKDKDKNITVKCYYLIPMTNVFLFNKYYIVKVKCDL
jgi:hypothetical protein